MKPQSKQSGKKLSQLQVSQDTPKTRAEPLSIDTLMEKLPTTGGKLTTFIRGAKEELTISETSSHSIGRTIVTKATIIQIGAVR